jgi:predicted nucleic acid-binding protein
MLLIDTSVWISVFRDRNGQVRQQLETLLVTSAKTKYIE